MHPISHFAALVLCTALATGCSAQEEPAPGSRPAATQAPHAALDAILRTTVHGELVDYLAVRDRHFGALTAYLGARAEVDPAELTRNQRLAHFINLYNATMIRAVCERLRAGYTVAEKDWGVFAEPLVRTKGKTISLNALENEIIRPEFGEPRIHVALVCGARSCPPILGRAYTAADLEQRLEANMKRFVGDAQRNVVTADRVRLSRIFEWYAADFGGDDGLLVYVSRYAGRDVTGAEVEFLEYSWDLNIAAPDRRYVEVREASEHVERGAILEVLEEKDRRLRLRRPFGGGEIQVAASATTPYRQ